MASAVDSSISRKRRKLNPPDAGPYILRSLVDSLPVVPEGGDENVHINCVELWSKFRLICCIVIYFRPWEAGVLVT